MTTLIQLLTFISVFLLFFALYGLFGFIKTPIERRVQEVRTSYRRDENYRHHHPIDTRPERNIITTLGEQVAPTEEERASAARKRLASAGYYSRSAYYTYWGLKILLMMVLPMLMIFYSILLTLPPKQYILQILFLFFLGFYLCDIFLYYRTKKRQEDIFCGMPDMLDLLVVCVEAGVGLDAGLQKVSEEFSLSNKTLSQELRITCTSTRLGQSRDEALHDLGERTNSKELKSFISVIIQSEKFGTSIAQALRTHSEDLRIKRRQRAEEHAAKISVKLLFPLAFFIFPAIIVVTAAPVVISIYENFIKR